MKKINISYISYLNTFMSLSKKINSNYIPFFTEGINLIIFNIQNPIGQEIKWHLK